MSTTPKPQLDRLIAEARHLVESKQDLDRARQLACQVRAALDDAGRRSAYVEWVLAVASDYQDRLPEALTLIEGARDLDPIDPTYRQSQDAIMHRIRERVHAGGETPEADAAVTELHRLLVERDLVDRDAHLAMARQHERLGRWGDALALYEALAHLFPMNLAAREGVERCAARTGDDPRAASARDERAAVEAARQHPRPPRPVRA